MVEELREQIIQEEEPFEFEEERRSVKFLRGIDPRQRLLLAILLFLNVAICGCLVLALTGRVVFPF